MNKKALSLAICAALALPTITGALSLGEIESNSNLNQPFRGKINLLSTNAAEAKTLRVRIAPPAVFNRVGIDRPAFLNSLRFRTTLQNGKPVIMVSSNQPINEPFLNFLLEISWPNGQLLKEYTVLLDPPVLMTPNTAIANNTAGVRAEPGQSASNANQTLYRQAQQLLQQTQQRRVVRAPQGQTTARRAAAAPTRRSSAVTSYRVKRGDTLNKIAKNLGYRGVSRDQMILALFEKNKRAFTANNMNNLKANVVLQRPTMDHAKSVTRADAKKNIISQARAWKKARATQVAANKGKKAATTVASKDQARMEVAGTTDGAVDAAKAAALAASGKASVADLRKQLVATSEALESRKKANQELKSRVAEMESLLRKKNRLISMKSQQLTKLQASISGKPAVVTEGADIEATVKGQTEGEGTGTIVRPQAEETAVKATEAEAAKDAVKDTTATEKDAEVESAEAAIVAAAQKKAEEEKAAAEDKILKEKQLARAKAAEAAAAATATEAESASGIMGLLDSPDAIKYGAGGGAALALLGGLWFMRRRNSYKEFDADDYADEDSFDLHSEGAEETAQLATDFTATDYDGFDEGIDVISDADRDDSVTGDEEDDLLQEADVYIVYGLYDQAESELKEAISKSPNNLAYRTKLLENYKASGNVAAFEADAQEFKALDVNGKGDYWEQICEWGNALSPNNKLFTGSVAAAVATGVAMVAGTASPEVDNEVDLESLLGADQADISAEEFENIDLDAILSEDMASDSMDEDSSLMTDIDELDLGEPDFADIEMGGIDTIEVEAEQKPDFDLDAEIGSLDSLLDEAVAEESNVDSSEEATTFDLDLAENGIDLNMNAPSLDMGTPSLDLDLDVDSKGLDNILSSDSAYKSADAKDDNLLSDFDDNLSFLDLSADEEVEETQIESKIDLAKAYIDMGDIEGARSTLEEVMQDGSEEQRLEAEELLHHTG